MDRENIEEAIEVLEDASAEMLTETGNENYYGEAIAVLRQVLKTDQEPVAWLSEGGDVSRSKRYMDEMGFKCTPLYTSPPQRELTCVCGAVWEGEMMVHPPRKREWVGLTDEEIQDLGYLSEKFDASNSI